MAENEKNCGCSCGCSHEEGHQEGYDIINLSLDDDKEVSYIIRGIFECDDEEYIALIPEDEKEGEDVYLFRYKESGEDEVELDEIENEEEFDRVSKKFDQLFIEEDDFNE